MNRHQGFVSATRIAIALLVTMTMVHGGVAAAATEGDSLSLARAIELACGASDGVRAAAAGVKQARGAQASAQGAYLPRLDASASYTRTFDSPFSQVAGGGLASAGLGAEHAYTGTLSGSLDVISPGRWQGLRAASSGRRAADLELRAQRAQAVLDAVGTYYEAALSDELVSIAEASLVHSEALVRQAEVADSSGAGSGYDLLRAQVARDNQVPALLAKRRDRDLAHLKLAQALGLDTERALELTTALDAPESLLGAAAGNGGGPVLAPAIESAIGRAGGLATFGPADTTVEERVPVHEKRLALAQARSRLLSTRLRRLPSLTLSGSYGRSAYPSSSWPIGGSLPSSSATLGLALPVFTAGSQRASELEAEASLEQAQVALAKTRKQATQELRSTRLDWARSHASWKAAGGTAERASRAYRIAEARWHEGLATQMEVDDARIAEAEALSNRVQAARDLLVAGIRLALLSDLPLGTASTTTGSASTASTTGENP